MPHGEAASLLAYGSVSGACMAFVAFEEWSNFVHSVAETVLDFPDIKLRIKHVWSEVLIEFHFEMYTNDITFILLVSSFLFVASSFKRKYFENIHLSCKIGGQEYFVHEINSQIYFHPSTNIVLTKFGAMIILMSLKFEVGWFQSRKNNE